MNFKKSNFVKLVVACAILATQSNVALANVEKETNAAQEQLAFLQNRVFEVEQLREEIASLQAQIDEKAQAHEALEGDVDQAASLMVPVQTISTFAAGVAFLSTWDTGPKGQSYAKSLAHLLRHNTGKVTVMTGGIALAVIATKRYGDLQLEVLFSARDLSQLRINLQRAEMRLQHESRALSRLIDIQTR